MLTAGVNSIQDMDERELVALVAQGDRAAYRTLFDRHAVRVLNTAMKILGNRQDAEDITQDVFFTFWKKAGSIRGDSQLSTWLYRVAINKAINARKHTGVWSGLKGMFSLDEDSSYELPAPSESRPDRQQEMKAAENQLAELLSELPQRQREVYLLHKLEGLSYKEIAEELGLTLPAVESVMHRAKVKLQKLMLKRYKKSRK